MVNVLRKYQQSLMIAITIMVIIAFIWFYNTTQFEKIGGQQIATIYDKSLSRSDVDRFQREFYMAIDLGLNNYIQLLGGMEQGGFEEFIFNRIVTKHEAKRLQIHATDDEVYASLKSLPVFQTNGQFDSSKLGEFYQKGLAPRGFTEGQLEAFVRDALIAEKLKELIAATSETSEAEYRSIYEQQFRKIQAQVVKFSTADLLPRIEVSDEELQNAYEQRKSSLKSEEKRQVKFVHLTLTPEAEKQLSGNDRTKALQPLADKAQEFAQEMLNKDAKFEDVAAKYNLKVEATDMFTRSAPDDNLKAPELLSKAFALTEADPNSDAVQSDDTFYIMRLEKVEPPRELTFAEAKNDLRAQLKEERASEQLYTKAAEVRNKITEEIKGGKTFEQAAAAQGLKVEKPEPFSLGEPPKNPKAVTREMVARAAEMSPGQVSEFTPSEEGGFIVYFEQRLPLDEKKYEEDKPVMMPRFRMARETMLFREWLKASREKANVQVSSVGRA